MRRGSGWKCRGILGWATLVIAQPCVGDENRRKSAVGAMSDVLSLGGWVVRRETFLTNEADFV